MQNHAHKASVKLFAWLLIPLMPSLGAGQLPVVCFESDGRVVVEAECNPVVSAHNLIRGEDRLQTNQVDHCFECVDLRLEIFPFENATIIKSKPDPSVQALAAQSIAISLICFLRSQPTTSSESDTIHSPTRLALKTVILLV